MKYSPFLCLVIVAFTSACTRRVSYGHVGDVPTTFTTADVRMVTSRPSPTAPNRTIVCTEPGPDSLRLVTDSQTLSGAAPNGIKVGVDTKAAEQAIELAGRSTAVLGLRDGLFRACEAAGNGYIGQLAYTLVLNRYGQAMVTLLLAQDTQAAAFGSAKPDSGKPSGDAMPSGDANGGKKSDGQSPKKDIVPSLFLNDADLDWGRLVHEASDSQLLRDGKKSKASSSKHPETSSTQGKNAGGGASSDIAKMQANYLALTSSLPELAHLAMIACLEEYDPTRAAPVINGKVILNPLLEANCPAFVASVFGKLPYEMSTGRSAMPDSNPPR